MPFCVRTLRLNLFFNRGVRKGGMHKERKENSIAGGAVAGDTTCLLIPQLCRRKIDNKPFQEYPFIALALPFQVAVELEQPLG